MAQIEDERMLGPSENGDDGESQAIRDENEVVREDRFRLPGQVRLP